MALIRGSADFTPLDPEGRAQAKKLGEALERRGGLTCVYQSTAVRARQTVDALKAADTDLDVEDPVPDILSWRLGGLEGVPVAEAQPKILALAKYLPSQAPNGKSDITGLSGESFDDFRWRALPYLAKQFLETLKNPKLRLGIVSHHRVLKLLDAWIAGGCSNVFNVNADRFANLVEIGHPAGVWRVMPVGPKWKLETFNVYADGPLPTGAYFIRHASTGMNSAGNSVGAVGDGFRGRATTGAGKS